MWAACFCCLSSWLHIRGRAGSVRAHSRVCRFSGLVDQQGVCALLAEMLHKRVLSLAPNSCC